MKKFLMLSVFACLIISTASCQKKSKEYKKLGDGLFADIATNKGDMIVKLYYNETPITVASFVSLAEGTNQYVTIDTLKGKPYFDGLTFHRVIENFMIQGGDPNGNGSGSPGYQFKNEIVDSLTFDDKGILAMANSGPNTNGSQFFITQKENKGLNYGYTIFGKTVEGLAVIDTIAKVKTARGDKPVDPVIITHVEIVRNGKAAKKFDADEILKAYFDNVNTAGKKVLEAAEKQKEQAETTESGLKIYYINKAENGEAPAEGSFALVNYAGYLQADGTLFDSNIKQVAIDFGKYDAKRDKANGYAPIPMQYSSSARLIPGFKEALLKMKVGDKVRVFIPSFLGYGERGAGNVIPANADLIFDLEIVGTK